MYFTIVDRYKVEHVEFFSVWFGFLLKQWF